MKGKQSKERGRRKGGETEEELSIQHCVLELPTLPTKLTPQIQQVRVLGQ